MCGETKTVDNFHRKASAKDGCHTYCIVCNCKRVIEWQKANREKHRANNQKWHERNKQELNAYGKEWRTTINPKRRKEQLVDQKFAKYGLTRDIYETMLSAQNHCCAICGIDAGKLQKALSVDHCHITGLVRGLLCSGCNFALGAFKDNIDSLTKAIIYLQNASVVQCEGQNK